MKPKSAELLALLGHLYLQHGKAAEAVAALEGLTTIEPKNQKARFALAYAYVLNGDHQNGLDTIIEYSRKNPTNMNVELVRARALWGLGRQKDARRAVQQLPDQQLPDQLSEDSRINNG